MEAQPAAQGIERAGGERTIVCVHGATLDHRAFDSQVPELRSAGYRVVTWDLPGHGANRDSESDVSVDGAADDLLALIDQIGDPVVLIGQSFGGLVAQEAARISPDRVTAMVLIGAPAISDRPPWHHRVVSRMRPALLRMWPERHLRRVLPRFMSKHEEVRRYVSEAADVLSKAMLITVTKAAVEPLLSVASVHPSPIPVLLVRGEAETSFVADMIDAWSARDPLVDVVTVPGAGHLANQDETGAFNTAVLRFLTDHVPIEATQ